MNRNEMINTIGSCYLTSNIEGGEYSYVRKAGNRNKLINALGRQIEHFKLDIRFELNDVVVLIETKQRFVASDENQLRDYLDCERAVNNTTRCICILANTSNDEIKVWQSFVDEEHLLMDETVLENMEYYVLLFSTRRQNNRELVLKNTYALNELLHKMDIDENKRSQFVGTTLLYIKDLVHRSGAITIDEQTVQKLENTWELMNPDAIRGAINGVLTTLLDGSENKEKKIELLQTSVINDQKVRRLSSRNWIEILKTILKDIYRYINTDSAEGQDILNLFFIAFNKYTGKSDKNQAFTPDHITDFMCRVTDVDRSKVVIDICCGSGSFLVQAMVKELADCRRNKTRSEAESLMEEVKKNHIFGIENEEKAYGLSTTNMLIHGDGNSNIILADCFRSKEFIKTANPDIILMNPPYNSKPIGIPDEYKTNWGNSQNGKEDPTKGMVFIHYLSDIVEEMNKERERKGYPLKTVKLAVLLPVSAAIGNGKILESEKTYMLRNNTLEAVFTLPDEVFYPGASVTVCCMVFTLGKPHVNADGTINETFFGYYKEDGFKKKKNLGRVEQFNETGSKWREIEAKWLSMYRNKKIVDGLSAMAVVSGEDEWLCEAYMKTDYSTLSEEDFQRTINNYLSFLVKEGEIYES